LMAKAAAMMLIVRPFMFLLFGVWIRQSFDVRICDFAEEGLCAWDFEDSRNETSSPSPAIAKGVRSFMATA
jgi:hypothetical protein